MLFANLRSQICASKSNVGGISQRQSQCITAKAYQVEFVWRLSATHVSFSLGETNVVHILHILSSPTLAMLRLLPRAIPRPRHLKRSRRSFHDDTAILINLGANGQLVTTQHPITIGEPHEAYVMIPVEVGRVFQAAAATQQSPSFGVRNSEFKCPLWFFHETKHFAQSIESFCSL
jgi:hypothetical protein